MRPNRFQSTVCRRVLAEQLGEAAADALLRHAKVNQLSAVLPSGPRDLPALARELQPFVDLYRTLQTEAGPPLALQLIRRCIIDSGLVSHSAEAEDPTDTTASPQSQPLNLTSPPPAGFAISDAALEQGFALAMAYFSCEGKLLAYSPERVQFHITDCNWCRAMQNAGAPELIPFICETDERFMDAHPTHRLRRPTAIGLGDSHCDFQFVPIADIDADIGTDIDETTK